jgi:hypothetical protein
MRSNRNRFHQFFLCSLIFGVLSWHHEADSGLLHLTWSDDSQNQDGFEIERRSADTGEFSFIAVVPGHQTWYSDHNLAYNTTYCYRIRAYNKTGDSPYSHELCATTLALERTIKTVSTNISNGSILSGSSVKWTAVPSGIPQRVEFFINDNLLGTELIAPYQFNGDPSGVLNTNMLANGSHQLKVRAVYPDSSTAERTVVVTVSNPLGTTINRHRRRV